MPLDEKFVLLFRDIMKQILTADLVNIEQVAQLWQRDRTKLEMFSINFHRYSQNHAQNCFFGPPCVRIRGSVSALFDNFNAKKLCSRVSWRECQFHSQNSKLAFLSHLLVGRGGTNMSTSAFVEGLGHVGAKY